VEAFGPPDHSLGRDDHWALTPFPSALTLNILLNGSGDMPAVWVFDPYGEPEGVVKSVVHNERELDDIIQAIRDRV
jgi:hypothetical protein